MTAPVLMQASATEQSQEGGSSSSSMSFFLPSKYKAVEDAPRPTDSRVVVRMMPARTMAARTFSWNLNSDNCQTNLDALLQELERDEEWTVQRAADGTPSHQFAGFNAPFVLPWCKTNEVYVAVEPKQGSVSSGAGDQPKASSL